MIHISDSNSDETVETITNALDLVEEWFQDYADWTNGWSTDEERSVVRNAIDSVERPSDECNLEDVQNYASNICDAIAESQNVSDWCGHGNYYVSAADRIGLSLTVTEE